MHVARRVSAKYPSTKRLLTAYEGHDEGRFAPPDPCGARVPTGARGAEMPGAFGRIFRECARQQAGKAGGVKDGHAAEGSCPRPPRHEYTCAASGCLWLRGMRPRRRVLSSPRRAAIPCRRGRFWPRPCRWLRPRPPCPQCRADRHGPLRDPPSHRAFGQCRRRPFIGGGVGAFRDTSPPDRSAVLGTFHWADGRGKAQNVPFL
jgi:hypothetical protein